MKITAVGSAPKTENFMTYEVCGDILVGRGMATWAAWSHGEILWDHVTPLKLDRTKEPLAVGEGKAVTAWADSKKGPTHYEARDLVTGETIWRTKLQIRADKGGICFTSKGLAVVGYHHKQERNYVAFLNPENGELLHEFYCKGAKGVASVGLSTFAWGPYGVFILENEEFQCLDDAPVMKASAKDEHLFILSRARSKKPIETRLRRWNLRGELDGDVLLAEDGSYGGRLLALDEHRVVVGMDPGTGPCLVDLQKESLLWKELQEGRTILSLWKLDDQVIALCKDGTGTKSLQTWQTNTGEHSSCDDLGYVGWAAIVGGQLVLGHGGDGIQGYDITFCAKK